MTTLTSKGLASVSTIKTTYQNLIDAGYTDRNAFAKTAYDRCANKPASIIQFAIGTPCQDDFDDMRRRGYAE